MTSIDFPPEVDEFEIAGLTKLPSIKVKPPRIAESPANLECRLASTVEIGNTRDSVGGNYLFAYKKRVFRSLRKSNRSYRSNFTGRQDAQETVFIPELLICLIYRVYLLKNGKSMKRVVKIYE